MPSTLVFGSRALLAVEHYDAPISSDRNSFLEVPEPPFSKFNVPTAANRVLLLPATTVEMCLPRENRGPAAPADA